MIFVGTYLESPTLDPSDNTWVTVAQWVVRNRAESKGRAA